MISLIYVSSARLLFSQEDLLDLLLESRATHERLGVTGLLLYKDGNFMHLLEGKKETVVALFDQIDRDPRHHGVFKIMQVPITERQFTDWSMSFYDLQSKEARALPGYSEFLNTPFTGNEFSTNPTRGQKLLLAFKRTN